MIEFAGEVLFDDLKKVESLAEEEEDQGSS